MVLPLQKADAVANSPTAFHKLGPERCRVQGGQPGQSVPLVHISRAGDLMPQPAVRTRQPESIFAISQPPRLAPRSNIGTLSTTGSLLCKYEGIDGWNLKWLSLRPRVWTGNLVWFNPLASLFAWDSLFILKLTEPQTSELVRSSEPSQTFDKRTQLSREGGDQPKVALPGGGHWDSEGHPATAGQGRGGFSETFKKFFFN